VSTTPAGSLEAKLRSRRFVVTAELTPPVSCDPSDLLNKALPLRGLADAFNVNDAPGAHAHLAAVTAGAILVQNGFEPIVQMTCRDRNRIALQGDLLAVAASGARNLLLLRGDDPTRGDQPDAKAVFDLDAVGLIETARTIRDRGALPSGRAVGGRAGFFLGAADIPIDPPPGWSPDGLAAKVAAGAEFVQTQFCMDTGVVRRYARALADAGLLDRLFLIVGIAPLRSARAARWMRHHLAGTIIPDALIERIERAADPAAEGRRACIELAAELAAIPGVAGAHIMAPNHDEALPEVLAALARLPRRAAPA
jgi:methylenetetrahydrofolate reductase (NADPH)